jgi:hypothetical protein
LGVARQLIAGRAAKQTGPHRAAAPGFCNFVQGRQGTGETVDGQEQGLHWTGVRVGGAQRSQSAPTTGASGVGAARRLARARWRLLRGREDGHRMGRRARCRADRREAIHREYAGRGVVRPASPSPHFTLPALLSGPSLPYRHLPPAPRPRRDSCSNTLGRDSSGPA